MATEYFNDAWRIPNNKNQSLVSNYSMKFDGSGNDSITIPSYTIPENSTVSFWIKSSLTNPQDIIISGVAGHYYPYFLLSGGNIRLIIKAGSISNEIISDVAWVADTWFHIAITGENGQGAGSTATYYINGVSKGTSLHRAPTLTVIGDYTTASLAWNGQIDQVCFFDYALPATGTNSIATLYGGGTAVTNPMSLSPKPVAAYQLGDQSVDNGANYLVPNNSLNGSKGYSPYALSFDGINDNFPLGTASSLNFTGDLSISFWIKTTDTRTFVGFAGKWGGVGFRDWIISHNNGVISFTVSSTGTTAGNGNVTGNTAVNDGNWHHVLVVNDSTTTNNYIYIDGYQDATASVGRSIVGSATTGSYISRYSLTSNLRYLGDMSNFAFWNTVVTPEQVTEIYNSGRPSNLNNFSGDTPVHWWQFGSNSSFNAGAWTCLDEMGTLNAVSEASMAEDDITNGVGYSANGLGTSSIEIVGDAPYSTANGISVNMDVLDRTTDVPS